MLVQPSRKALTPSFPATLNWEVAAVLAAELAGEASQRLWEVGALQEQSSLPVQAWAGPHISALSSLSKNTGLWKSSLVSSIKYG